MTKSKSTRRSNENSNPSNGIALAQIRPVIQMILPQVQADILGFAIAYLFGLGSYVDGRAEMREGIVRDLRTKPDLMAWAERFVVEMQEASVFIGPWDTVEMMRRIYVDTAERMEDQNGMDMSKAN